MNHVTLGNTGIKAVRLGFGGIPIQRVSETQAIEVVLYALEKGMDFIDTSRVYTTSEGRIGKALKQTDQKVSVATKSFSSCWASLTSGSADVPLSSENLSIMPSRPGVAAFARSTRIRS